MAKAQVLFPLLSSVIGQHEKCINVKSNFFDLGGSSLNSVYTVSKLSEKGFYIGITDFITAETIMDILVKIESRRGLKTEDMNPQEFKSEMLKESHKSEIIK